MQKIQNSVVLSCPYLLLTTSLGVTKVTLGSQDSWKIGRGKGNDINLPDKSASRNHAIVQVIGKDEYLFIDLGSRNGSFIQSRRVTIPTSLKNGDRITIGDSCIEFFKASGTPNRSTTTSTIATQTLHKRSLITLLVVDIRNFTGLAQQLDERVLSHLMSTWFRKSGAIISSYGSWVDKYIGDAVMSVWIHDVSFENSEKNDKSSGQDIIQAFCALRDLFIMTNQLNQEFNLPFPLRVGAGMNTGFAMVGQMGTSSHPDYTVLGDTVNAAFRLESVTKEINVDIALGLKTYQCIPKDHLLLLTFKKHFVTLKGYDKRIATFAGNLADLEHFLDNITL
jgi:adenylate cyclase